MALSPLNWRYVGVQSFTAGDVFRANDAVYLLGTATTYADGSARTPGSGSAWTWAQEGTGATAVAAYGTPPINALSMKYIVAGDATTTAYTFLTPDTLGAANCVKVGMARAAGSYPSWTTSQPFTTGFSGYWRATRPFATIAYDSVAMWESQEGCILQYAQASTGLTSFATFGALFDPLSSATGNCESDGRLYFMGGSGSAATTNNAFWSLGAADGNLLAGVNTAHSAHFACFAPGSTVMLGGAGNTTFRILTGTISNTLLAPNGDIVRIPFVNTLSGTLLNYVCGQSRNMFIVKDSVSRLKWDASGTTIGYIVGASSTTQADACLLLY
jgi:hypothetical protein